MDIMSSLVTSVEGYNYALIIVDDASIYRWIYGLKDKNEANDAARKWISYVICHNSERDIDSRSVWGSEECRSQGTY